MDSSWRQYIRGLRLGRFPMISLWRIYQQIIEVWGKPGVKEIYEVFVSDMPSSKIEEIKQALIHPENALLPDPNKPFKDIEKIFANMEINDELITDGDNQLFGPRRKAAC